jgi:hypothetical protein
MLAKCGILQGNPTRRAVNIGPMTTVGAAAVDPPDLAGSRRERAGGPSGTSSACAWAVMMRLTSRRGRAGYIS